ncbi:CHASE domain-containing protein [Chitinimonas lacunae]|uniref:histidine kinase n=1 Tax=Chitinimonas lacunae TaxID=1963018 RepID=A0ABV8MMR5_9NEIS
MPHSSPLPFRRRVGGYLPGFVLIAAAYYLTGRLGLLLAIPPGYATAVWPPSGIALAALLLGGYRYWPAVLVGSLLLNFGVAVDSSAQQDWHESGLIAVSISLGAAVQALVGAILTRRLLGQPARLDDERAVAGLLVLGGPLACMINASWSVTVLVAAGSISPSAYGYSWWTWWVGDTIGVLIFAPLTLIWHPGSARVWRRRRLLITLPLAVCFALTVWVFFQVNHWEVVRQRQWFIERSEDFQDMMQSRISRYIAELELIRDVQQLRPRFDRAIFLPLAENLLARESDMLSLSWVPWVPAAGRAEFERLLSEEMGQPLQILERQKDGQMVKATMREAYVPLDLMLNRSGSSRPMRGFDLLTEPARAETLRQAARSGQSTATAWVPLLSRPDEVGVIIYVPIYRTPATAAENPRPLQGYLAGGFRLTDLVAAAVEDQRFEQIEFRLHDRALPQSSALHFFSVGGRPHWYSPPLNEVRKLFGASLTVEVAGRQWDLQAWPTPGYLAANRSWHAWAVLASGLLFTGIVGAFMMVLTGRASRVASLVEQRTEELALSNQRLTEEISRRSESERDLQQKNLELEHANAAKDRFLASMSHELRTPLNAIIGFTGTLLMRLPGPLNEAQQRQLQTIQHSARYLLSLINDLLDLARIESGKVQLALEKVRCCDVLEEVLPTLRPLAEEKGLQLALLPGGEAVSVHTDRRALAQIVINLISNAIKYTEQGEVRVEVRQSEVAGTKLAEIRVSDTGCGIRPEDQARLFQAFGQLDDSTTRRHDGTGLGLYLSQKFAQLLGGQITFSSEYGQGSVFTVTLPAL